MRNKRMNRVALVAGASIALSPFAGVGIALAEGTGATTAGEETTTNTGGGTGATTAGEETAAPTTPVETASGNGTGAATTGNEAPSEPVYEPVVEQPVETAPVVEEPVYEPVVEQPVETAPVVEQPVVYEPVVEQPVETAPVVEQPVVEQPVVENTAPVETAPVVEDTTATAPVVEQPVVEQPVQAAPVVEQPAPEPVDTFRVTVNTGAISDVDSVSTYKTGDYGYTANVDYEGSNVYNNNVTHEQVIDAGNQIEQAYNDAPYSEDVTAAVTPVAEQATTDYQSWNASEDGQKANEVVGQIGNEAAKTTQNLIDNSNGFIEVTPSIA